MKAEFEANIDKEGYVGQNGWVEEYHINPNDGRMIEDILEKFEGKKARIIIEEIS